MRAAGDDGGRLARGARGRARPARTRGAAPSPLLARAALLRASASAFNVVELRRGRLEASELHDAAAAGGRQVLALRLQWRERERELKRRRQ